MLFVFIALALVGYSSWKLIPKEEQPFSEEESKQLSERYTNPEKAKQNYKSRMELLRKTWFK